MQWHDVTRKIWWATGGQAKFWGGSVPPWHPPSFAPGHSQWRTQKISEGYGQVSSQSCDVTIVWRHKSTSGEVPTARPIWRGPGHAPGKFCKITPKNTHFRVFWKQVLDNTVFTFFIFRVWGDGHGTVAFPLRTLVVTAHYGVGISW